MKRTKLCAKLDNRNKDWTFFAPDNTDLDLGTTNFDVAKDILKLHILEGKYTFNSLDCQDKYTATSGGRVTIKCRDGGDSKYAVGDGNKCDNGVCNDEDNWPEMSRDVTRAANGIIIGVGDTLKP